jgi:hypothetical protein
MQDTPVNPIKHKKFLLALIFALPNSVQIGLQKVGCYSSSPLKQNLVPRFLSVEVRGVETKIELDFKRLLFQPLVDTLSCVEDLLLQKM